MFAELIRSDLKEKKMSLRDLSKLTGIPYSSLNDQLSKNEFKTATLKKIGDVIGRVLEYNKENKDRQMLYTEEDVQKILDESINELNFKKKTLNK